MNETALDGVFAHQKITPLDKWIKRVSGIYKVVLILTAVVWLTSFIGLFLIVG